MIGGILGISCDVVRGVRVSCRLARAVVWRSRSRVMLGALCVFGIDGVCHVGFSCRGLLWNVLVPVYVIAVALVSFRG